MDDNALDDDQHEAEEELGPSLALPPLYVLRAAERCPACGEAVHVFTLGCAAFQDAGDRRPLEDFHLLNFIESVPGAVLMLLKARCPGYFLDAAEVADRPYLMNHCPCGARLDDTSLHWDIGGAFSPDMPEGYQSIRLFRLPIEEPMPLECSYTLGGGEYLDTEQAESW